MSLSEQFIGQAEESKVKSLDQLQSLVIDWATEKGIMNQPLPKKQLEKMYEEVDELKDEINSNNLTGIKMELGDVIVTTIVMSGVYGISARECLELAYEKIKNRQGQMIDGKFVKDK